MVAVLVATRLAEVGCVLHRAAGNLALATTTVGDDWAKAGEVGAISVSAHLVQFNDTYSHEDERRIVSMNSRHVPGMRFWAHLAKVAGVSLRAALHLATKCCHVGDWK